MEQAAETMIDFGCVARLSQRFASPRSVNRPSSCCILSSSGAWSPSRQTVELSTSKSWISAFAFSSPLVLSHHLIDRMRPSAVGISDGNNSQFNSGMVLRAWNSYRLPLNPQHLRE